MWTKAMWLGVLVVALVASADAKAKLNVPRILLPVFRDMSTSYTLEITPPVGCYKWSTSRSDLIEIRLGDHRSYCSVNATVVVKTTEMIRNMAIVVAEEVNTKEVLRADVIVDVIHSLHIATTTRQLFMEEPPEKFEVQAHDEQGNVFSTLHGVPFNWTIKGGNYENLPILNFISFHESIYETPLSIADFDNNQKQGHIVLIDGVRTGSSKVSVQLDCPEYNFVEPVEVTLVVIVNLIIEPSEAFIIKGDSVDYRLMQIKHSRLIGIDPEVALQYSLVSSDESLVKITKHTVQGLELGVVKLTLVDGTQMNDALRFPSTQLTVVEPFRINLVMEPIDNWMLIKGDSALLTAELYTQDLHRIHIGPNTKISITVPEKIFGVKRQVTNGSVIQGTALDLGFGEVKATLMSSKGLFQSSSKTLTTSKTLTVYPSIVLTPEFLYVPWNPSKPKFKIPYSATGGDGDYLWTTLDSSVAMISEEGILETKGIGGTIVTVSMRRDQTKFDTGTVHVLEPISMEIIPHIHEVPIGNTINVHISLVGQVNNEFVHLEHCDHLNFEVQVAKPFVYVETKESSSMKNACAVLQIFSHEAGVAKVIVTYRTSKSDLVAETLVSSYRSLTTEHPKARKPVVLTLGSSSPIVFRYGPNHNFGNVIPTVKYNKGILTYQSLIERHQLYVISVTCTKLGESTVTLKLKSEPAIKLSEGILVQSDVTVICANPKIMSLEVDLPSPCLLSSAFLMFCQISSKYEFKVILKDDNGNDFDNATSLLFEWNPNKGEMISIERKSPLLLRESAFLPDVYIPDGHYKTIYTKNKTGHVDLNIQLVGFQKSILSSLGKNEESKDSMPFVSTQFPIKIGHKVATDVKTLSIFNLPNVQGEILIQEGSGYIDVFDLPEGIVSWSKHGDKIKIKPINEGSTVLTIKDNCAPNVSTTVDIKVSKLKLIKLEVVEKIPSDTVFTASISFYGKDNELLSLPRTLINEFDTYLTIGSTTILKLEGPENGIIDSATNTIKFKLRALNHGESALTARFLDLTSETVFVHVFPAITISPHSLVLCVGAEIQVSITGGPTPPYRDIQFIVTDNQIINVDSVGVVKGLQIGKTLVKAVAYDSHGKISSADSIEVTVVPLTGVRIVAPINKILVGNEMPIWVSGVPSQLSPLVIGSIKPPLKFHWSVTLPRVLKVYNVFENAHVKVSNENHLSMRLKALKPGHSHVHVSITGRNLDGTLVSFNSTIEIQVLSNLHWVKPDFVDSKPLIVSPGSHFTVTTNKNRERPVEYKIIHFDPESHQDVSQAPIESSDGNIVIKNKKGSAFILASYKEKEETQFIHHSYMVKPVHYIMLNVQAQIDSHAIVLSTLPQGLNLKLTVTYHDNLGNVFYAAALDLDSHFNVFDRTNISPITKDEFVVSLEKEGNTTLRIFDSSGSVEDFIKFPVLNHVSPLKKTISIDDLLCFTTIGNYNGSWKVDSEIMQIDNYGFAMPLKKGSAVVSFKSDAGEPLQISSYLSVDILETEMLQLGPLPDEIISNSVEGDSFFIPVLFRTSNSERIKYQPTKCNRNSIVPISSNIFRCDIKFNSIDANLPLEHLFIANAEFNADLGVHGCRITTLTGPNYNTSIITNNISIRTYHLRENVASDSLLIHFVPAFFIMQRRLFFESGGSNTQRLRIFCVPEILNQITIEASDRLLFIVSNPTTESNGYDFTVTLDPHYLKKGMENKEQYLIVSSQLTKQNVKVLIIIEDLFDNDSSSIKSLLPLVNETKCGEFQWFLAFDFLLPYIFIILVSTLFIFFVHNMLGFFGLNNFFTSTVDSEIRSPYRPKLVPLQDPEITFSRSYQSRSGPWYTYD